VMQRVREGQAEIAAASRAVAANFARVVRFSAAG